MIFTHTTELCDAKTGHKMLLFAGTTAAKPSLGMTQSIEWYSVVFRLYFVVDPMPKRSLDLCPSGVPSIFVWSTRTKTLRVGPVLVWHGSTVNNHLRSDLKKEIACLSACLSYVKFDIVSSTLFDILSPVENLKKKRKENYCKVWIVSPACSRLIFNLEKPRPVQIFPHTVSLRPELSPSDYFSSHDINCWPRSINVTNIDFESNPTIKSKPPLKIYGLNVESSQH